MAGLQSKINKLLLAFRHKHSKLVKIDTAQIWSNEKQKFFTLYTVNEISEEKNKLRDELKAGKKKLKQIKKCQNKDKLEKLIQEKEEYLLTNFIHKSEFFRKLDVLLFLVTEYKKVNNNETAENDR